MRIPLLAVCLAASLLAAGSPSMAEGFRFAGPPADVCSLPGVALAADLDPATGTVGLLFRDRLAVVGPDGKVHETELPDRLAAGTPPAGRASLFLRELYGDGRLYALFSFAGTARGGVAGIAEGRPRLLFETDGFIALASRGHDPVRLLLAEGDDGRSGPPFVRLTAHNPFFAELGDEQIAGPFAEAAGFGWALSQDGCAMPPAGTAGRTDLPPAGCLQLLTPGLAVACSPDPPRPGPASDRLRLIDLVTGAQLDAMDLPGGYVFSLGSAPAGDRFELVVPLVDFAAGTSRIVRLAVGPTGAE